MAVQWDWREEGFKEAPQLVHAPPNMRVFRAWGGSSTVQGDPGRTGVCFSTDRPVSRRDAERLFSVFEYRNPCLHLTEFIVPAGTAIWVGTVHPGDYSMSGRRSGGVQVFIENPAAQTLALVRTDALVNDLGGNWVSSKYGNA
jgi:hypothetical protein